MIELDAHEYSIYTDHNAALFGPLAMSEHKNPDGRTVRADSLQGTVGLYIEVCGDRLEATTACAWYIDQLRSLLRAVEVAAAKADVAPSGKVVDGR